MKVPFGDLKLHYQSLKAPIDEAVARVLASGYYILGPELERFEQEFARYLGCQFTVGCASGTEAIYLALAALDVGPGDEVLVVAHTAVPTISAISMTGATPVFVDINPETYVMDALDLERKFTKRSKVVIPVHLYGLMAEIEKIMSIAAQHNVPVIEDVAQATGATFRGVTAGTIGRFGSFSFYPSKNLGAFGDGGAVSCNSRPDYEKLMMLRNYGQSKRYHHDIVGINSRLDEMQAAILAVQIPFVRKWNERRQQLAARYTHGLKDVVQTPVTPSDFEHVYHLYVIQTDNRDQMQSYLLDRGIGTLIHYPIPAHRQKAYQYLDYAENSLPTTERVTKRILSLPLFPELEDGQIDYVIETIREFCETSGGKKSDKMLLPPNQVPNLR